MLSVQISSLNVCDLENLARGKKRSGVNFFSHAFSSNIQPPIQNAKKGIIFKVAAFSFFWNCLEVVKIDFFERFHPKKSRQALKKICY